MVEGSRPALLERLAAVYAILADLRSCSGMTPTALEVMTGGYPKKSRTSGQAGGILLGGFGAGKDLAARQVGRARRSKILPTFKIRYFSPTRNRGGGW
jgi:hypothetical protein